MKPQRVRAAPRRESCKRLSETLLVVARVPVDCFGDDQTEVFDHNHGKDGGC